MPIVKGSMFSFNAVFLTALAIMGIFSVSCKSLQKEANSSVPKEIANATNYEHLVDSLQDDSFARLSHRLSHHTSLPTKGYETVAIDGGNLKGNQNKPLGFPNKSSSLKVHGLNGGESALESSTFENSSHPGYAAILGTREIPLQITIPDQQTHPQSFKKVELNYQSRDARSRLSQNMDSIHPLKNTRPQERLEISRAFKSEKSLLDYDYNSVIPDDLKSQLEEFVGEGKKEDGEGNLHSVHVLQQWENLEESFRESVDAVVRQALPLLVKASSEINLSKGCYASFFQLLLGLRRLRPWAFKMIDAFGKPPAGVLQGTVTSFGAYDECVNIVATSDQRPDDDHVQQYFRGKYCTVEIKPPLPPKPQYYTMYEPISILANFSSKDDNVVRQAARQAHAFYFLTYRVDICVPSTCTQNDVNNMAQFAAKYVDIEVTVPRCSVKESLHFDDVQIAILCFIGVLSGLVFFSTVLDSLREMFKSVLLIQKCLNSIVAKIILTFSLNSNANQLLDSRPRSSLDCLHGMRFFAMTWLVLGHTYFSSNVQMYGNLTEASAFAEGFLFQVIVNSTVSIDTFFFINGVLLSYMVLRNGQKRNQFSIPRMIIQRYIRIAPTYLMVIGTTLLLPHVGSGPFWNETVDPVVKTCKESWWTNILFVNNLVTTPSERCLDHSWYLSCDFQLFVISLFVLLALMRYPALGISLNIFFIFGSILSTGLLTYYYKVPPTLLASFPDPEERKYLNHVIISKPFCHLGASCVGLVTGYFFVNCQKIHLKMYHHLLGWGSSISITAAVVYGVLEWNKGHMPSKSVALAYAATHRTAWALGLSWITVVCVAGHGGIINRFLSWKVFIPLSRLTYIVYLVHPLIQYILTGYIRERLQTNHIILAYFFFGHIMTSYALSSVCFFLFDGPMAAFTRVVLGDFQPSASCMSTVMEETDSPKNRTETSTKRNAKD